MLLLPKSPEIAAFPLASLLLSLLSIKNHERKETPSIAKRSS